MNWQLLCFELLKAAFYITLGRLLGLFFAYAMNAAICNRGLSFFGYLRSVRANFFRVHNWIDVRK